MPFTPYHFGPGLFAKSLAPTWFSMAAFAATQVVIDLETLYHLVQRHTVVHRELHTFVGATIAGLATAGTLVAALSLLRRFDVVREVLPNLDDDPCATAHGTDVGSLRRLWRWVAPSGLAGEVRPAAIVVGAVVGGISHPLFDGLMHSDMRPFRPFSESTPLLGLVSFRGIHELCDVAGILGIAILLARIVIAWRRGAAASDPEVQ